MRQDILKMPKLKHQLTEEDLIVIKKGLKDSQKVVSIFRGFQKGFNTFIEDGEYFEEQRRKKRKRAASPSSSDTDADSDSSLTSVESKKKRGRKSQKKKK